MYASKKKQKRSKKKKKSFNDESSKDINVETIETNNQITDKSFTF